MISDRPMPAKVFARVSVVERDELRQASFQSGLHVSEIAREAIGRISRSPGDTSAVELASALDAAGRDFNEGAWCANVCARRWGRSCLVDDESFERLMGTLSTCSRFVTRAGDGLAEASGAASSLARNPPFLISAQRGSGVEMCSISLRVSEEERDLANRQARARGVSLASWLRMALLTQVRGAADDSVTVTEDEVARLMTAVIRWRTNNKQASRSLRIVREAQGSSPLITDEQADDVVVACVEASRALDETWRRFVSLVLPLEASGLLRGVGICPS